MHIIDLFSFFLLNNQGFPISGLRRVQDLRKNDFLFLQALPPPPSPRTKPPYGGGPPHDWPQEMTFLKNIWPPQ